MSVRTAPARAARRTLLLLLVCLALPGSPGGAGSAPGAGAAFAAEVRFTDGGVLKLHVLDERLTLQTPYGKLVIPFSEVHELEFATRVPDAVARRITAAVAALGSPEFKTRDAASAELLKLGAAAYPALLAAEKSKDAEVQRRARLLVDKLRKSAPEEALELRPRDVVHTEHSKIAGRIEAPFFRAETAQFGEVRLRLADVQTLRSLAHRPAEPAEGAIPDPGHLASYQHQVGKVLRIQVTGAIAGGNVWGTNVYTLDSSLAMAAVHAGLVRAGQRGVVRVKILGPTNGFQGSTRNGVTSAPYGVYPGAYEFIRKAAPDAPGGR